MSCGPDLVLRRATIVVVVLVEEVGVGVEGHRRRGTGLPGDLGDRRPLRDQQADEAVTEVRRASVRRTGLGGSVCERASAPVAARSARHAEPSGAAPAVARPYERRRMEIP